MAVIGGGLAGLGLSIQLVKAGVDVTLFEKEHYPFHRVCGEYVSLESWDHLSELGVPLATINPPVIKKIYLSSSNGKEVLIDLPRGGFGISRYTLDSKLAEIASLHGVKLLQGKKVTDVDFAGNNFILKCADGLELNASVVAASYGKRSNLDVKWERPFTKARKNKLSNYIGVKYHVGGDHPADTISLHCFPGGYCGLVKIEDEKYNLCYLTNAANLQNAGSIEELEARILTQNPVLKQLLGRIKRLTDPITISQVSFEKKSQVENHLLFTGDASSMIAPLCGNGMSMALHASKICFESILPFIQKKISRGEMEKNYQERWNKEFTTRLYFGRQLQKISQNDFQMNLLLGAGKRFPGMLKALIRKTHGTRF